VPNVVNAIDVTHIHLADLLNHKMTLAMGDFLNRKKIRLIVLQGVCDANNIFWNVCVNQIGGEGVHDGGRFKMSNLYL
jgi:hypothetical protein